jgi:hypothetical protein
MRGKKMRRRRSSLLDLGHVLLEAVDATIGYLKGGLISVLVSSAVALVLFELLGAAIVAIVQWATSGAILVPAALQLQLGIVTPIACGLVTLLSIANLLRLIGSACLRGARTAVASARLHGVSDAAYDVDVWPLPIATSPSYVIPTPLVPSLPTQPLVQPRLPYRQTRPDYYVHPWSASTPWTYPWPERPNVYDRYGRGALSYSAPVDPTPFVSPVPTPYGYPYGALYPVSAQAADLSHQGRVA